MESGAEMFDTVCGLEDCHVCGNRQYCYNINAFKQMHISCYHEDWGRSGIEDFDSAQTVTMSILVLIASILV